METYQVHQRRRLARGFSYERLGYAGCNDFSKSSIPANPPSLVKGETSGLDFNVAVSFFPRPTGGTGHELLVSTLSAFEDFVDIIMRSAYTHGRLHFSRWLTPYEWWRDARTFVHGSKYKF